MAERAAHEMHPRTGLERFAPEPGAAPRVKVDQELYVVASTEDMKAHGSVQAPMTNGAAHDKLRELVKANPSEAGQWQVLSAHEAGAA